MSSPTSTPWIARCAALLGVLTLPLGAALAFDNVNLLMLGSSAYHLPLGSSWPCRALFFSGAAVCHLRGIEVENGAKSRKAALPVGDRSTPSVYTRDGQEFVAAAAGGARTAPSRSEQKASTDR